MPKYIQHLGIIDVQLHYKRTTNDHSDVVADTMQLSILIGLAP